MKRSVGHCHGCLRTDQEFSARNDKPSCVHVNMPIIMPEHLKRMHNQSLGYPKYLLVELSCSTLLLSTFKAVTKYSVCSVSPCYTCAAAVMSLQSYVRA